MGRERWELARSVRLWCEKPSCAFVGKKAPTAFRGNKRRVLFVGREGRLSLRKTQHNSMGTKKFPMVTKPFFSSQKKRFLVPPKTHVLFGKKRMGHYFQKWGTISISGVLLRRKGWGTISKSGALFFFRRASGSALLFLKGHNSTPFGTI